MRDYVRTRGWEAVEYVDTASAGDLVHRSSWARLLADVARRRVDLIMIWKLDRASRSTLHALATLRDFEHAGVGFASFTQPELDTTSATGRLVFTILAAVAEMERELIADRVREGMRHAARQGKQIGRPPVTARPGFAARVEPGPPGPCRRTALTAASGPPARDRDRDPRATPGRRPRQRRARQWLSRPDEATRLVGSTRRNGQARRSVHEPRDRINPAIAGGGSSVSAHPIWSGQMG